MSPTCRLQNFSRKGIDVTLTNVQLNSGKGKKNGKLKEKKFRKLGKFLPILFFQM